MWTGKGSLTFQFVRRSPDQSAHCWQQDEEAASAGWQLVGSRQEEARQAAGFPRNPALSTLLLPGPRLLGKTKPCRYTITLACSIHTDIFQKVPRGRD